MAETAVSRWTLPSYVQAVLQVSPDYMGDQQRLAAALSQWKGQLAAQWLPTLAATGQTYPYGNDPTEGYAFKHGRADVADMGLATTANWNLFNSFSDHLKTRQSSLAKRTSAETLETTRQSVALSAMRAFYDLGLQDRLLEVAKENLKALGEQYRTTQNLYQQGIKSLSDQLKSETDLRSSEERLAAAEGQRRDALLQFNLLLDAPLDGAQTLEIGSDLETTALPILSEGEQEAVARRPEIQRARTAVESGEISVDQARQQGLPQGTVDFSYNRFDNGSSVGTVPIPGGALAAYASVPPNYQLAVKLALPFGFNGVSQYEAVSAAGAAAKAAVHDFDVVHRQVFMEVHSAYISLDQAIAIHGIATRKEGIAQRTLQLVNQQYRSGSADVIRLGEAQLDFLNARVERAQALRDARVARAQYLLATGAPLWK